MNRPLSAYQSENSTPVDIVARDLTLHKRQPATPNKKRRNQNDDADVASQRFLFSPSPCKRKRRNENLTKIKIPRSTARRKLTFTDDDGTANCENHIKRPQQKQELQQPRRLVITKSKPLTIKERLRRL